MKKQFDFLRMEGLSVILANCWGFLTILSSKKSILASLLFFLFLFSKSNVVFGQTINNPSPVPSNSCAELPITIGVTPATIPIVWTELNGNGTFSNGSNNNTTEIDYTPNQTSGSARLDMVVATLDEGYPAIWTINNNSGIDTTNGKFICTVDGQGNSGAKSVNVIKKNNDGWVEAKYSTIVQSAFGLSSSSSGFNKDPNSIDFGIQVSPATSTNPQSTGVVIENGVTLIAPVTVSANDIFRVERIGNTIVYKHNRAIIYTTANYTNVELRADATMSIKDDEMDLDVSFGDNSYVFPADTISLNILQGLTIDVGPDIEICEGDEAELTLTSSSFIEEWTHDDGSFNDNTLVYTPDPLASVLFRKDTVIGKTFPASNGVCPAISDTAVITIRKAPSISITPIVNNSICEEDSIMITAEPGGNSDSIFWTTNLGSFNIANGITDVPNDDIRYFPNKGLNTATRTDEIFLETDSDFSVCPTAKDTVDIIVHWADSIYNTFVVAEICEGDSIEMKAIRAKGAIGDNLTWSILHSTGSFSTTATSSDTNAIYIPNSLTQGDSVRFDTLLVTTVPAGTLTCDAFVDTVVVKVFEIDEVTNSFNTFAICEGDSVQMNTTLSGAAEKILWTIHDGAGTFIDEDSTDAIYIPTDISDNALVRYDTLFVTTIPTGSCTPAVDTVVVSLHRVGELTLSQDTTICLQDSALLRSLSYMVSIDTIETWQRVTNGTASVLTDQEPNDTLRYNFMDNVNFTFPTLSRVDTIVALTDIPSLMEITNVSSNQTCIAATDTVLVTIIDTASISIVAASDTICEGEMTHLDSIKAVIHSGATGVTWKLYPGHNGRGTFTAVDSVTTRYTPKDISGNTVVSRNDTLMAISTGLLGCQPDTAYVEVVIYNGISLDPIADLTLCNGEEIILKTRMKGVGSFTGWAVASNTTTGTFSGQTSSNTATSQKVTYETAFVDPRTTARTDNIKFSAISTSAFCPDVRDSLDITINPSHLVEITTTGIAGATGAPDSLEVCEGERIRINGKKGNGTQSIEWTSNSNNGVFSKPTSTANNFNTFYTPSIGQIADVRFDTIKLESTNTVSSCTSAQELIIVKVYKVTALSATPDTLACESGTVTLSALSTGFGDTVFWNILHGAGKFANTKILDTTTTATNEVIYDPIPVSSGQLRIDTIVYSSMNHRNATGNIICPVVTDTIFVSVYNQPTIEVDDPTKAIDTAYICEGIGLALDGSYGDGAVGATWSVLGNQGVFSNILNDTIATYTPNQGVPNAQRVDTVILTSNILTGTCTSLSKTDTLFVIVEKGPVITTVNDSLTMCEGETIDIEGTFGSVATGFSWSTKVIGSGIIDSLSSINGIGKATYTPTGTITSPGRLDVIYLTSNNGTATCLQAVDSIEIFVSANPTLELGPDISMCGALTQVLIPQSSGVNNQLTWTSTDGTFATNPSPTGLYQPDFTVPTYSRPDGIIVTSIDSLGLCTAVKDTMLVTVYGLARIDIGETGTICEDDTITLNTAFAGTINDFTYTVSNNDGIVGVNNNQLFYIPNENTTQSSRIDQIVVDLGDVDGTGACPSLMDTIDVTVLNTPRSILVGDTTICAGEQVNLLTETFGIIDTFSSAYSTSLINYPSTFPTLIGGELKDTIIYGTRLINAACPADLTQIVVTIKEAGTIALNLPDTTICEANTLAFDAGLSNPNAYEYQWQTVSNIGNFDAMDIANPIYTPTAGIATTTRLDTIILTAVDTSNICNIGIDTIVVTVIPSATLEDLRDTIICEGEALNLSATVNGAATFFWASNSGTFADSTLQQTTYTHAPVNGGNGIDLVTANISFANNACTNVQKTMRVTVVGQLVVEAGKDTSICTGSTLQLAGTLGIGIDSAEWLVINNAGTFDNSKNLNAIYTPTLNTGTTDRVDILILNTSTTLNCAVPIDTILVTVMPVPTVNIGVDQIHMGTPDIIFTAITSEIVEIGQWRGGNGSFTNSTVNQTLYAPNDLGEGETRLDTIIYTADFGLVGCQTLSDTVVITFEAPPVIERNVDNVFCESLCLVDTAGANIDRITGEIVVLANNLDQFDTCQVRPELDLKFWYPELGVPEPLNVMDFPGLPDSIIYDCSDRGTKNINVYVASDSMNIQLCPAVVKVEDSFLTCGERVVSGRITTFRGEPIEGFQVFVENVGAVGGVVPDPVLTDANGRYEFTLIANKEYRIIPRNNEDLTKGVTAFDNVVISRHILGLEQFDSPFQTIAADVNKSGSVTAFDIVLIRKVVLARDDQFQNNSSWRFIDAHYVFPDIITAAAAPFMESFLVEENMGNVNNMDFIAVKIGDANGTVSPNDLQETESRNGAAITFQTTNLPIEKDKIYEIPFQLLNTAKVAGYQFTLAFEGLELMEIKEGIASDEHFGLTMQNRGLLMASWSTANPIATDETWFTLNFKANKSGVLREMLDLNSTVTPIEGITADQQEVGVQLNFVQPVDAGFDLYQNNPNPFKNSTTIGFTLPEASTAQLTILDVQGKEIQVINGGYEAGYNAVTLDLGSLPKGVFYYRLETAFGTKVQKMMHLE